MAIGSACTRPQDDCRLPQGQWRWPSRKVCAHFIALCRAMGLLTQASVAIDGSKFKAVNNRDKNFYARQDGAAAWRRSRRASRAILSSSTLPTGRNRQRPSQPKRTASKRRSRRWKQLDAASRASQGGDANFATPDQQISLTDPDARSMATSGRGSGIVGYNVQIAVEANHHLIVMHEVTNDGTDPIASSPTCGQRDQDGAGRGQARCRRRPRLLQQRRYLGMRGGRHHGYAAKAHDLERKGGRTLRQAGLPLWWLPRTFTFVLPAKKLAYHYTTEENGLVLRRYWTNVCQSCAIRPTCTTGKETSTDHPMGTSSTFSKPFSAGSTSIQRRCASAARRSNIPSAPSRPGWEQPIS